MKHLKKFNEDVKSEEIPTAENFIPDDNYYFVETLPGNSETCLLKEDVPQIMIDFAKLHVEAALKRAHSNMQLPEEDLEFTMGAYPLENIK